MKRWVVEIIVRAQITASDHEKAREVGNEIAQEIADQEPHHLMYETEFWKATEDNTHD